MNLNTEAILSAFRQFGVNDQDAMQVLGLVAAELQKSARVEKARKTGLTVDELDSREVGAELARRINAKMGYGQKGAK